MRIDIAGHHVEITDAIREAVHQKLNKVASHYPQVQSFNVTLTVERNIQRAEVSAHYQGNVYAVKSENTDLYSAISDAGKKIESQLSHKKAAKKSHRHDKPHTEIEPTPDELDDIE